MKNTPGRSSGRNSGKGKPAYKSTRSSSGDRKTTDKKFSRPSRDGGESRDFSDKPKRRPARTGDSFDAPRANRRPRISGSTERPESSRTPRTSRSPRSSEKPDGFRDSGRSKFGRSAGKSESFGDKRFSKPRRTEGGSESFGDKRFSKPRRTEGGSESFGDKRFSKPRRTEGGSESFGDKRFSKPRRTEGGSESYSDRRSGKPTRSGRGADSPREPRRPRTTEAYGSSDGFKERKRLPSLKDAAEKTEKRFEGDRKSRSAAPKNTKFTKKSEMKGFRPRISKEESETDFRFMKPGSKGKDLHFTEVENKGSAKRTPPKERVTENALKVGESVRLNRYISNAGVCSRREADELIAAGLVSVNGTTVTELGTKVNAGDVVRFNGEKLSVEEKVYIVLNKPKDAITTAEDPDGRPTVMDLFKGKMNERIFPVGRLDRNTTGVLLLTNDGEMAQRLMHPKYEVHKVYRATLNKQLKPTDLWTLTNGVELEDGFIQPDAIACPDPKDKALVGVELHSGRNRIIHRMFEHLGYTVDKLDRVLYAGLEKGKLKRGEWRELTDKELKNLKRMVHLK